MDESEIIENLNEQWDFIAEQVFEIAGLLFDGNPDFRLINSEIIRNKILTVTTFENGEDFEFSSDYLNNVSKMNCGQAWHSLVNSRQIIDSRNNVLLANSHIVEAGVLVGCAWRHHQSVTVKNSIAGKARNKWEKNYPIVEKFYMDNTNGKGLNLSRTSIIANHIEAEKIVDSSRGEILKMIAQIKKCA